MIRQLPDAAQFTFVPRIPIPTNRFQSNLESDSWPQSSGRLVLEANAGDHSMILQYLKSTLPFVTEYDFEYVLDSPDYDPKCRFIIRNGAEILGHVRLENRTVRFGTALLQTVDLKEASVYPELENSSCQRALLAAARQKAMQLGASLMTRRIESGNLGEEGWAAIPTGNHVAICPHDLLGRVEVFQESKVEARKASKGYSVRPWRYIERSEVMEVFEKATADCEGIMERSDEYWHWLLARRGFDRAYVVVDDHSTESESGEIVGYAFVRNNQVAELATNSSHSFAALSLLRRIALDAVERGIHSLVFLGGSLPQKLPIPIDGTFETETKQARVLATAISIDGLAKQMAAELFANCRNEGLSTGTKLGIQCGSEKITLSVQRKRISVQRGLKCGESIQVSPTLAASLFLGQLDSLDAFDKGDIEATGRLAAGIASKLFAKRDLKRMPLNDLRSL